MDAASFSIGCFEGKIKFLEIFQKFALEKDFCLFSGKRVK